MSFELVHFLCHWVSVLISNKHFLSIPCFVFRFLFLFSFIYLNVFQLYIFFNRICVLVIVKRRISRLASHFRFMLLEPIHERECGPTFRKVENIVEDEAIKTICLASISELVSVYLTLHYKTSVNPKCKAPNVWESVGSLINFSVYWACK